MSCPEIEFAGIDKDLYDKLLAQAERSNVKIDGTRAELGKISLDWNYDAPSTTLRVTCTKKPWFMSCEQIENRIRGLIQQTKIEGV